MSVAVKKRRRSERGNWIVVSFREGEIQWVKWVRTWAGVQMSKRNSEKLNGARDELFKTKSRVLVMDIERMVDFATTEGANEIHDLYKLFEK